MDQKWTLPHQHHVRKQAQTHHKNTQRTAYQLPLHTKRMSNEYHSPLFTFLFPPLHLYPEKRAKLFEVSPCETGCPLRESTVPDSLLKILKSLKPFSPRSPPPPPPRKISEVYVHFRPGEHLQNAHGIVTKSQAVVQGVKMNSMPILKFNYKIELLSLVFYSHYCKIQFKNN